MPKREKVGSDGRLEMTKKPAPGVPGAGFDSEPTRQLAAFCATPRRVFCSIRRHSTPNTVAMPSSTCGRPVTGSMMKQMTA